MAPGILANGWHDDVAITSKPIQTRYPYENLHFNPKLQPKRYETAARDSVIQSVEHGVDVIYYASYTDDVGMNMLSKAKHKHVVAPAINWLYTTVHEAEPFGYTFEKAEQIGYNKELEIAIKALKEMNKRGITVPPGGDDGFAWCPHGTYARDMEHFVKLLDFMPMESIIAGVSKLFMQENELGKILPGYYADCILVDGDPLQDIAVLQDHSKLDVIMINGRIHKSSPSDVVTARPPPPAQPLQVKNLHNFVTFKDERDRARVGHLDLEPLVVHALAMPSGSPLSSLQEVIDLGHDAVVQTRDSFPLSSVKLLAPIAARDIMSVGNNYADHVKEYSESGYDAQKIQQKASFPTIFTKRSTSVIAADEELSSHRVFTHCLDYEGEVGVIIGKPGFGIREKDAIGHV
ncbi:uncharacterized protein Z519_11478 [Cladophialophora bantiana CBS 173.52]|uniref:Fumarylacetoacetase-like C-terminal domain-containing protein n=1 Tax=Cladophialophora bantiana (strain ATCC 10958 / CBS 173.52 / CDC B-1940 / NIH 8579) TaxID=1442370 RepID=A0A0D2HTV3_CLAB1|nr:uncharacterized protein Z519_11478 [Cladophialophora bantiana CBS 173.52]KIW87894.1 hypothetical protein Z519_11478 [Cladophialophora bantiana CBS 173.52]